MPDTDSLYDVAQRIATVTLNRPDRLEAHTAWARNCAPTWPT